MFALMADRYKEQVGEAIRKGRDRLGLTQAELADRVHVSGGTTVSRWERGKNLPKDLSVVAGALEMTLTDLFKGIKAPDARAARKASIIYEQEPELAISPLDLKRLERKLDLLSRKVAGRPTVESIHRFEQGVEELERILRALGHEPESGAGDP